MEILKDLLRLSVQGHTENNWKSQQAHRCPGLQLKHRDGSDGEGTNEHTEVLLQAVTFLSHFFQ